MRTRARRLRLAFREDRAPSGDGRDVERVGTGARLAPSPPIRALRESVLALRESMLAQSGTILHALQVEGSRGKSATGRRRSGPDGDNSDAAGAMCRTIHMKSAATR